jgi:hypothetical protein
MTPKTLEALRASIAHWLDNEQVLEEDDVTYSVRDCALCGLFFKNDCESCPVSKWTGLTACKGSPYTEAVEAFADWIGASQTFLAQWRAREAFHNAAREERQFLESLLPKDPHND